MLSTQAIEAAMPLAEKLGKNGINLGAITGSPLQLLVSATGATGNMVKKVDGQLVVDALYMSQIANTGDPMTGYSEHDAVMSDVVAKAKPGLLAQIAYARNEGAAVVEELAERVQASADQLNYTTLSGSGVHVRKDNALLNDPAFVDAVEQSREMALADFDLEMDLPKLSGHEVRTYLNTGHVKTDQAVSEVFESFTDDQLATLWESVYTPSNGANRVSLSTFIAGDENLSRAMFVYLTAMRLCTKIIDGANMSEQRYMSVASTFRNAAARRICIGIDSQKSDIEMGRMVYGVEGQTVVVNGTLYARYLKEGGTVDAILGASTTGKAENMTLSALQEKRELFEARWREQWTMSQKTYANKFFNRVKEILSVEFAHQCGEATDEDFPLADRQIAVHLFNREVEKLRQEDISDIRMLCLKLLGASRFRNRSVCEILTGIAMVRKVNPDVPPAEAANIAIIEYVSRWLVSMMIPERSQTLTRG